ncbi:NADH:flavin oxidoreductase [Hyaloraphidium curvatum]|nr:NADH:flavin oxidoreductase [Hyaloraphidium curvatum]
MAEPKTNGHALPLLFTPIKIRSLELKNRVVVAPMHQYAAKDGFPTTWHTQNYGRYSAGGAGLVIFESTKVERRGCGTVGDLGLWDDAFVAPLAEIVKLVKGNGAAAGIQLGHSGRKARTGRPWEGSKPLNWEDAPEISDASWEAWKIVGPSAVNDEGWPIPHEPSTEEVWGMVRAFGEAARRANEAGFDMVEIHGAHGYLVHEFLSPVANQRTDDFGGSTEKRHRFALEVAKAVRAAMPEHKPVFMRLSVDDDAGWSPDDSVALARKLKDIGIDVIDCSGGGMTARPVRSAPIGYGYQVPYAEKLKREAGIMTMAVGLIIEHEQAERILSEGRADLVALGREMLYNPSWPMDAANKFGLDGYGMVPPAYGWWLGKRSAAFKGELITSTAGKPVEGAK